MDKILLIGNLGNDPEMRFTPSGQAVANFSMATTRKWTTSSGEKGEETKWYRIAVWGNQAEACNTYLHKGSKVFVEGSLKPDPATGSPRVYSKSDGSAGASYEVTAHNVEFLDPPSNTGQSQQDEFAPF